MFGAAASVGDHDTTNGKPVEGRASATNGCATAVNSGLVPSTTMLVPRISSKAGPGVSVRDAGAGINCGPVVTGRGTVGVGDGTVVQAARRSVPDRITARDM